MDFWLKIGQKANLKVWPISILLKQIFSLHNLIHKLIIHLSDLPGHKKFYAKDHAVMKDLREIVKEIKPSVLIGQYYNLLPYCLNLLPEIVCIMND